MRRWRVALVAALGLTGCSESPTVVVSERSPDGRLIARLVGTDPGAASHHLLLDVGLADAGPFITLADLTDPSEPFALRWIGSTELEARLPCVPTTVRGQLEQQVRLPDTSAPVAVRLVRPAACKLPLNPMR